jgi:hypothetical protein
VRNFIALVDSSGNSRIVLQFWRCKIIGILPIYPPSPHTFQCWRPATRYQIFVGPTLNWGFHVEQNSFIWDRCNLCKVTLVRKTNVVLFQNALLWSMEPCYLNMFFSFLVFSFSYIDTNYSFGRAISTLNLFLN